MTRSLSSLLALLLLASCARTVRVGVVLPETGSAAVYGAAIKSGLQVALAAADDDRRGGLRIAVDYRDSGSEPERAASLAARLIEEGALLIVGGITSAEARAMIPIADAMEAVLLSPSASAPGLSGRSSFFFRIYPSDEHEGVKAADFLAITSGLGRVLVVQEDNEYSRGLLNVFVAELRHRGARVAGTVQTDEPSWPALLRRAIASEAPDGVYICGYGDAVLEVLGALRALGYAGMICTTSALNATELLQRGGRAVEGVYFPRLAFDVGSPEEPTRSFVNAYRDAYGMAPDLYAACGYDAGVVIRSALARLRGASGTGAREALREIGNLRGATGPIAFDDRGDIRPTLHIHLVRGGRVEDVEAQRVPEGR